LRRIPAPTTFDLGDEGGDRSPDCLGMIFLQEVDAIAELDQPAILELARELFGKSWRDERARVGGEEKLRIG